MRSTSRVGGPAVWTAAALSLVITALGLSASGKAEEPSGTAPPLDTVLAWGSDFYGQLGKDGPFPSDEIDSSANPYRIPLPAPVVQLAAGQVHSVALVDDGKEGDGLGSVWTWGRGLEGELGQGEKKSSEEVIPDDEGNDTIVVNGENGIFQVMYREGDELKTLENIKAIAAGYRHTLALDKDGVVWAWGSNVCGQLGDPEALGDVVPQLSTVAVQVRGLPEKDGKGTIKEIAAGAAHSMALEEGGRGWAWGDNSVGQLGNGAGAPDRIHASSVCNSEFTGAGQPVPTPVLLPEGAETIAAGSYHSLAKTKSGVWAWGDNCFGQSGVPVEAGDLQSPGRGVPALISASPAFKRVTALAAGDTHSLALDSIGQVWGWGQVDRLGASSLTGRPPVCAGALFQRGVTEVQTVASKVKEDIKPQAPPPGVKPIPVQVKVREGEALISLDGIESIAAGASHSLATNSAGELFGWGSNSSEQLGYPKPPGDSTGPCPENTPFPQCLETALTAERICESGTVSMAISRYQHNLAVSSSGDCPRPTPRPFEGRVKPGTSPPPLVPPGDSDSGLGAVPLSRPPQKTEPGMQAPSGPGGAVLVTGHTLDSLAERATGLGFLKRALEYVSSNRAGPRFLYVPGIEALESPDRMVQAGLEEGCGGSPGANGCFDSARSTKKRQPEEFEAGWWPYASRSLEDVSFSAYDAIVIGAVIFPAEADTLIVRQKDLFEFVNGGGGLLVNLAAAHDTCIAPPPLPTYDNRKNCQLWRDQPPSWDGARFMPFLKDRWVASSQSEAAALRHPPSAELFGPAVLTPEGRALGFTEEDQNAEDNKKWFAGTCGFDPVDALPDGRVITMVTRKPIPPPALFCGEVPDKVESEGSSGPKAFTFEVARADRQWARDSQQDAADGPVTIHYSTADVSAKGSLDCSTSSSVDGADYISTAGSVTFDPGEMGPKLVTVQVCGDVLPEPDEQFELKFSHAEDKNLRLTAVGTIVNDDFGIKENRDAGGASDAAFLGRGSTELEFLPGNTASSASRALSPAPAVAPAAVAPAPALAPELAQAQATSQASSQASSQAHMYVPQVGASFDRDRERQVEGAGTDPGDMPSEYLAASRPRGGPGLALALMTAAFAAAVATGRRLSHPVSPAPGRETVPDAGSAEDSWIWLRRLHDQR